MIKIAIGVCTLILENREWRTFDAQGRPWAHGEVLAGAALLNEIFFSQHPDLELAMAKRFVQKVGGHVVEHIPVALSPEKSIDAVTAGFASNKHDVVIKQRPPQMCLSWLCPSHSRNCFD